MNIRTKLAAVTLAAGTVIAGGAALSITSAQAQPAIHPPVVVDSLPTITISVPPTLVTVPPHVTLPPPTVVVPTLPQPRPTIPPTTTPPTTDHPPCVDCDPDWTGQGAVPIDPPVKGSPAFTG